MGAMKRTILVLSVLLAMAGTAPASAALLGADPRLGETLLNTRIRQVAGDVIAERLPGSSRLRNPGQLLRKPGVPPILRPSEFSTGAHDRTSKHGAKCTGDVARVDPNAIGFSQRTVGGSGRATPLRESMARGWNGPAIDAVQTPNGLITIDNTRVAIAQELGLPQIPVKVRLPLRSASAINARSIRKCDDLGGSSHSTSRQPTATPSARRNHDPATTATVKLSGYTSCQAKHHTVLSGSLTPGCQYESTHITLSRSCGRKSVQGIRSTRCLCKPSPSGQIPTMFSLRLARPNILMPWFT